MTTITINPTVDPLGPIDSDAVIVARSEASRVLEHELTRYCDGRIQGRSFLIAGHRGAGKTTMVADVLRVIKSKARDGGVAMRPLPVLLHGPSLFVNQGESVEGAMNDDLQRTGAENGKADPSGAGTQPASAPADQGKQPAASGECGENEDASASSGIEAQAQRALKQVILGLHRAVVLAYAESFHTWVKEAAQSAALGDDGAQRGLLQPLADWPELAAQFEIELMEDPPASRLRELYAGVGALTSGVLNAPSETARGVPADQGARELVALNGICMAHQRISGVISGRDEEKLSRRAEEQSKLGVTSQIANLAKPLTTIFAGVVVAGGAAAGAHPLWSSVLAGLVAALGTSFAFSYSSSSTKQRERTVDRTFIPDLSLRTLDRVLPMLLERLTKAGLAPVLVVDELDKIDMLSEQLEAMVRHLKKLMAENVFSCFLTDRGYLELVTRIERDKAYAKTYSYFSHPLFVAYEPADLDAYMTKLFEAPDESAKIDCDLLKWMLRHRSQMHALALNREIAAIRNELNQVTITSGELRDSPVYVIDITLQVAIEHRLNSSEVQRWLRQRPRMRLTLFDALYYISRKWQEGDKEIDLSDAKLATFHDELEKRMNLDEVCGSGVHGRKPDIFKDDDRNMLRDQVRALAEELSKAVPAFAQAPPPQAASAAGKHPVPPQWVVECLLTGDKTVLVALGDGEFRYAFRYYPSGDVVILPAPMGPPPPPIQSTTVQPMTGVGARQQDFSDAAKPLADFLDALERTLDSVLTDDGPPQPSGEIYHTLADRMGVLPTTPSARHAQQAKVRLAGATLSLTSIDSLKDDFDVLARFEQMVRANLDVIERAFSMAAYIGALHGNPTVGVAVHRGLWSLSVGLNLRQLDPDRVRYVLTRFITEMRDKVSLPPEHVDALLEDKPHPVDAESIAAIALMALNSARSISAAFDPQWPGLVEAAWTNFGSDSHGELLAESDRPARIALIVCAANDRGPGRFFSINPIFPALEDWTSVVARAVKPIYPITAEGDTLPPDMFARALRMLGFNLLPRERVAPVLEKFATRSLVPFHKLDEILGPRVDLEFSSKSGQPQEIVVVVVRSVSPSKTFLWSDSQKRETMVVVDIDMLIDASADFMRFLHLTSGVVLMWDGNPAPEKRTQVQARFEPGTVRRESFV